jgi:pimeloyl-ACP methyl ester carboxylesterase
MALPGSKFVLIENCGHFPWIEQPEQFWRSVDVALTACGLE